MVAWVFCEDIQGVDKLGDADGRSKFSAKATEGLVRDAIHWRQDQVTMDWEIANVKYGVRFHSLSIDAWNKDCSSRLFDFLNSPTAGIQDDWVLFTCQGCFQDGQGLV